MLTLLYLKLLKSKNEIKVFEKTKDANKGS